MLHVLTLDEVAEALRITRRYVEVLVRERRLRAFHIGSAIRVDPPDLQEFIRSCKETEAAADVTVEANPMPPLPPVLPAHPPLPVGTKRVASFTTLAKELTGQRTGTHGPRRGSHSRQRAAARSTSSTAAKPSTSGGGSSKGGAS